MPSGHGQEPLSLPQLHVRAPAEFGAWQTQKPGFSAPPESLYVPPATPCVLLQLWHIAAVHGCDACGTTPAGHSASAVVGIL
jgi:hypothetical protein